MEIVEANGRERNGVWLLQFARLLAGLVKWQPLMMFQSSGPRTWPSRAGSSSLRGRGDALLQKVVLVLAVVLLTACGDGGGSGGGTEDSISDTPDSAVLNPQQSPPKDTDDDTPGLVLSRRSLTIGEGGDGSYTLRLASQPSGPVTVNLMSSNGDVTVAPLSLDFSASTWNTVRTVTVTAGQDDDTANDTARMSHGASGGGYGAVTSRYR